MDSMKYKEILNEKLVASAKKSHIDHGRTVIRNICPNQHKKWPLKLSFWHAHSSPLTKTWLKTFGVSWRGSKTLEDLERFSVSVIPDSLFYILQSQDFTEDLVLLAKGCCTKCKGANNLSTKTLFFFFPPHKPSLPSEMASLPRVPRNF